ncbi:TetR/AcrR family transcriptional regulator [Streptomyces sp. NBC_00648]|uniref:TetR/AcrR family transcriptional regulator n=1 Tax=Streptomyces sp. NBC_00648 TaxID=2975797 RepID=UPI003251EA6B
MSEDVDAYGIPVIPEAVSVSQVKRRAIEEAALAEFLAGGYSAVSVDAIASRAGVSKPTVYKHFGSKERLFLAVIGAVLNGAYEELEPHGTALTRAVDLRSALIEVQLEWTLIQLDDRIVRLRRLVIGEVDRFPQLGRLWFRRSYAAMNAPLVEAFTELTRRGELAVPDPGLAVKQLVGTTISIPQLAKTFDPGYAPSHDEVEALVVAGVDVFLARYGVGGG